MSTSGEAPVSAWRASFGARLRYVRELHDLSQEALAERAGLDRKLIYRTELGQTSPRMDAVMRLASALGVQVRDLIPSAEQASDE